MLRVRTLLGGDTQGPALNTLFFDDADTQAAADAAASAVNTLWNSLKSGRPTYGTWQIDPEVAVINPVSGTLMGLWNVTSTSGVGTNVSGALPAQCQGLIRLRTNTFIDGRNLKGRIFVPGPCEDSNTNGVPLSGIVTMLANAGQALVADASTHLAIWHRPVYEGEGDDRVRKSDGAVYQVTSASGWTKWATLSSRRD